MVSKGGGHQNRENGWIQAIFSFLPHEKSPKDHNDDKRFYSPPAYQEHAPHSKWIKLGPHSDKTTRQFIQFNEEGKPISIEKIIRLAKCLLSRLSGFWSLTERPCAHLTNTFWLIWEREGRKSIDLICFWPTVYREKWVIFNNCEKCPNNVTEVC